MPSSARFPFEVIVTPRFDLFYALHALTSDAPVALESWKERAIQRLPRDLLRSSRRVAPVPIFWPLLADALKGHTGGMTFDEIFSKLRSMPVNELRANVLGGILHHRPTLDAMLSRKKSLGDVVKDENHPDGVLLSHFGLRPYAADAPAAVAIAYLLSDTASYRDQLTLVLQEFVQSGFGSDWASLEPALQADASRLKRTTEQSSMTTLAGELRLPVTFDEISGAMHTKAGTVVKLRQVQRCYLVPSAFNARRWWAKYESGDRVTLYFPVWNGPNAANALDTRPSTSRSAPRDDAGSGAPRINAEAVFRALGDTTRYAIASIIAREPTSSADLARRLQVSKPTITHHVHALRGAGLITETAEGGSSRLSLSRETLAALSAAAVDDLFSSTGKLPLLTTRQRRPV